MEFISLYKPQSSPFISNSGYYAYFENLTQPSLDVGVFLTEDLLLSYNLTL